MNAVLIAGGAGRLGTAIARRLVTDDWFVILADIRAEQVRAAAGIGAQHADAFQVDVTDVDGVRAAVDAVVAKYGPLAGLVNATGGRTGAAAGSFAESDPATWPAIVDLHLRGTINKCCADVPGDDRGTAGRDRLDRRDRGIRGDPNGALFSAAKAGVIVLSEMLVREGQPYGIRVNTVVPGNPESLARIGRSDDATAVADAVAFLLSDAAALTTGACLDVSGGWALH